MRGHSHSSPGTIIHGRAPQKSFSSATARRQTRPSRKAAPPPTCLLHKPSLSSFACSDDIPRLRSITPTSDTHDNQFLDNLSHVVVTTWVSKLKTMSTNEFLNYTLLPPQMTNELSTLTHSCWPLFLLSPGLMSAILGTVLHQSSN
jgi:hypothetical protein